MTEVERNSVVLVTNPFGWRVYINIRGRSWTFGTIEER